MAWVAQGVDVGECSQRLERYAVGAQKCVKENACKFDMEKTEVMLFTGKRRNKELKMKAEISVGKHELR